MIGKPVSFAFLLAGVVFLGGMMPAVSSAAPQKSLITPVVLGDIRDFLKGEIVSLSVKNQNVKYNTLTQEQIDALDQQWRAETKQDDQPLISATLTNPLSAYLTRVQAHSVGLYSEIFVMDKNGLNVGQSSISSDYWQGDEDKFQKTFPVSGNAVFIDEPELKEGLGVWCVQVNLSLADQETGDVIGAATVEVNLTELERRATQTQ